MQRAFLCHSSVDKEYVRIVANNLGRAKIVFDEMFFDPGEDFRDAIRRGLDDSVLFVFFASQNSLKSSWCQYEWEVAHENLIKGEIKKHLVIIIDNNITYTDLPKWMQASKVITQHRPTQATRTIQQTILSISETGSQKPFIGRSKTTESLVQALTSSTAPRLLIFTGLDGIGRRSVLTHFVPTNLGLLPGPTTVLEETADIQDLYLWLISETADLTTRNTLDSLLKSFSTLDDSSKVSLCLNQLKILCKDGNLPILIDDGCMLDENGRYRSGFQKLLDAFVSSNDDLYCAIVHRRNPYLSSFSPDRPIHIERIPPLAPSESRLLLTRLLKAQDISITNHQLDELVSAVDGYPPAAYYISTFVNTYGLSTLLADKSMLVEFKSGRFTAFLNSLNLASDYWFVLQFLSGESSMSLAGVSIACNKSMEETAKLLRHLVDLSLIVVSDDRYSISHPLRDALSRVRGFLSMDDYNDIRLRLTEAFWKTPETPPGLDIIDATIHAVVRSGNESLMTYSDLIRPSLIHRLANEAYHKKEWEQAFEYGVRAENMNVSREDLRALIFKSLVQLERWDEAEPRLYEMQQKGDRQSHYLKGFMLKKQRRHEAAVEAFHIAIQAGDRSLSVYRDYADSLYRCGRLDEALDSIQLVKERDPENLWVLDLLISIAIDLNREDLAQVSLEAMKLYDVNKRFYHHRNATFLAKKGQFELALVEAESACESEFAQLSAYTTKADILIELRKFKEAEEVLAYIYMHFGSQAKDIQLGVRCKLLVRQGNWREAKAVWLQIEGKQTRATQGIHLRILEAQLLEGNLVESERLAIEAQCQRLREKLS